VIWCFPGFFRLNGIKLARGTNPATMSFSEIYMYLSELIKRPSVRVMCVAMNIPVDTNLKHIAEVTILKALEGLRDFCRPAPEKLFAFL